MHRRNMLWGAVSAFGAVFAASRAGATTDAAPAAKLKVVYHLNDLDKVSFVLGNIQNHFDGVGGPDHVKIALVFTARRWVVSLECREPGYHPARRSIFQSRGRTRRLLATP